jgi:hypothetical protein
MLAFDGNTNGLDSIEESNQSTWESAHETSKGLHQLALRYWAEGRLDDATRVGTEAWRILGQIDPDSGLMAQITSTLKGIRQASGGRPTT